MRNTHNGFHDAVKVHLHGQTVEVDTKVVDLVVWLNAQPGVSTWTSCQGGGCSREAFIHFCCPHEQVLQQIKEFVSPYGSVEALGEMGYRMEFPDTDTLARLNETRFPNSSISHR